MMTRTLFAVLGLGLTPITVLAYGPWCFCQPVIGQPVVTYYYPPVTVVPGCSPCYTTGPVVIQERRNPTPAPNPAPSNAAQTNQMPPPKVQQLPGIGGKEPEKDKASSGLGKAAEPEKAPVPMEVKPAGGFAKPVPAVPMEPIYKLEPPKGDSPPPLKLDIPGASEELPTPRSSNPTPRSDVPPISLPTPGDAPKIPSITPPLPAPDPSSPPPLKLPNPLSIPESGSVSRSSPLTGGRPRFEVFTVDGPVAESGSRMVGFFNQTDREVKLTVQGETMTLPKWSRVSAKVPAGFRWQLDAEAQQTTQIPSDSPGLEVVIRR